MRHETHGAAQVHVRCPFDITGFVATGFQPLGHLEQHTCALLDSGAARGSPRPLGAGPPQIEMATLYYWTIQASTTPYARKIPRSTRLAVSVEERLRPRLRARGRRTRNINSRAGTAQ